MTAIDTSDVTSLRRLNAQTTLDCLRAEPTTWVTVRELAVRTKLSRPTVSRVLEDLEQAGWVRSVAGLPGGTGRPARRFCFNGAAGLILSVEAGPFAFNAMLADLAGTTQAEVSRRPPVITTSEELVGFFQELAAECLAGVDPGIPLRAVSLGLPGPVDEQGRLRVSITAPEWDGFDVRDTLRGLYPEAAVLIGRTGEFDTLAEITSGALVGVKNAVHVTFSDRCRATLVVGGRIVRGAHGMAGARPRTHGVGKNLAASWTPLRDLIYGDHPRQRMSEIVAAAQEGSEADVEVLTRYAHALAPRVSFLVRAVAPEVLVVGGQMLALPDIALPPLVAAVRASAGLDRRGSVDESRLPEVRLAHYSPAHAGPTGGLHAALSAIDWTV
jgi:predicted NBD/HSP70 family sugar kinase